MKNIVAKEMIILVLIDSNPPATYAGLVEGVGLATFFGIGSLE